MSRRGLARQALLALVLVVSLTGCGDDGDADPPATTRSSTPDTTPDTTPETGSASPDEEDTAAVTVVREGDTFTPNGERVELGVGQTLVLTITADEAGEIHVHSTPEQEIVYDAGTSEHEITIDRPGVVEVESHEPDLILLQLEVR